MRLFLSVMLFYKKIAIPAFILSMLLGILAFAISGEVSFIPVAVSYILLAVLFHYFTYEVMNPRQYYFYYNLGLSKLHLWGANLLLSLLFGLILLSI
jgi:hypothetical protein